MRLKTSTRTRLLLAVTFLLLGNLAQAQKTFFDLNRVNTEKQKYHVIGVAFGTQSLIDHATSPLIYSGGSVKLDLGRYRATTKHKTSYGIGLGGFATSPIAENAFGMSQGAKLDYSLGRMYTVKRVKRLSFDAGGSLLGSNVGRINSSLQNNGLGLESFHSLTLDAQMTLNLDRKYIKSWSLWKFRYQWNPMRRELTVGGKVGLLNHNLRNGYSYIDQSSVVNNFSLFGGYNSKISGQRLNTYVKYTKWRESGNGFEWAYHLQGFNTEHNSNFFGAVQQTIGFTYLINTK